MFKVFSFSPKSSEVTGRSVVHASITVHFWISQEELKAMNPTDCDLGYFYKVTFTNSSKYTSLSLKAPSLQVDQLSAEEAP